MDPIESLAKRVRRAVATRSDVPSPCISVCRMDPAGEWCEGCLRTLDEIAAWSRLDDEGRRQVWRSIGQRLQHRKSEACTDGVSGDDCARTGPA